MAAAKQIVKIPYGQLHEAAAQGTTAFFDLFAEATLKSVGGALTAENMSLLTAEQITIVAYATLREEVTMGGFIQLIHNGYGPFIFDNPFAKAVRRMGLHKFSNMVYDVHRLYAAHRAAIEKDCSDDDFMALYEKFPEFDEFDDEFVEHETEITAALAHYIDENIDKFAEVTTAKAE